ncbi:hypothetical protein [Streptomyces sp. KR55]|uniref:hypothetical protein n=1 Tax=Streptomyces sp. KR55 TaxID=3457425 RepID=UPI003FD07942
MAQASSSPDPTYDDPRAWRGSTMARVQAQPTAPQAPPQGRRACPRSASTRAAPIVDQGIDGNRIWYGNFIVTGFNAGGYLPIHPETVPPAAQAALKAVADGLANTEIERSLTNDWRTTRSTAASSSPREGTQQSPSDP